MQTSPDRKKVSQQSKEHVHGNPNMMLGGLTSPWPWDEPDYVYVTDVEQVVPVNNGVRLRCKTSDSSICTVFVTFYTPDVVRLNAVAGDTEQIGESTKYSLLISGPAAVDFKLQEKENELLLKNDKLTVVIEKSPWKFRILNNAGREYLHESRDDTFMHGGRRVHYLGYRKTETGPACFFNAIRLLPNEDLYGLGEKFLPLNRRGQTVESWNFNAWGATFERSYKNVPFLLSTNGYGLYVNTTNRVHYDLASGKTSSVSYELGIEDDHLDLFFISGPSFYEIIDRYTDLTGKATVPPKWSFGLWMSKYGYRSRKELEGIAKSIEANDVNVDVLHLDPYWLKDRMYADLIWDEESFPNPPEMIRNLRKKGYEICLWIQPWIPKESPVFQQLAEDGCFARTITGEVYLYVPTIPGDQPAECGVLDFSNPKTVAWYQSQIQRLVDMGIGAFKTDFGEAIPEDAVFYNGITGLEMHNLFPVLYNEAVNSIVTKRERGGLVWARSAYAGSQRYPVHWAGDSFANFDGMATQLWGGLSIGLSGIPFWSHDIGAYKGDLKPEVYIRWAAFGLLSSHARCHGLTPREPWIFGSEILAAFNKFNQLRYQLIPYLYSYAHVASKTGAPVLRAMILEFQEDPACRNIDLQYMLGKELLAAPVFNAEGQVDVYLPHGKWLNWWNGQMMEGGRYYQIEHVPLDEVPLYVRENSIVPLADQVKKVCDLSESSHLTLLVNVASQADYVLYDDEGESNITAVRNGETISISWNGLTYSSLTVVIAGCFNMELKMNDKNIQSEQTVQGMSVQINDVLSSGEVRLKMQ